MTENTRILGLSARTLDALMPMHIWIGPSGHILQCGCTLQKLLPEDPFPGAMFFDKFTIVRPRKVKDLSQLLQMNGAQLKIGLESLPNMHLKGTVVALPGGTGAFLNLSFGISVQDAVRRFDLSLTDFAASDLAVEVLYLIEANAAAMNASRDLVDRLQDAKTDAESRALTDTLTGLNNRRAMDMTFGQLLAHPPQDGFGLMLIDLDYFKSVNDTLGHAAGDLVLLEVAKVLREEVRADDKVFRVGGDEFVLVLRNCNDLDLMTRIADRIIARLEQPVHYEGKPCRISASIGITISDYYDPVEIDKMLSDADEATYASKNAGRAQHTVFKPAKRPAPEPARDLH
ncbi:diguanylate cyclase domain-containing protein [Dinoroseobacter sp. S375]|uniref:diguanylate cyclase domain-containing protein n=1 Tax=Dinoroseobacter sp. S375 TaxID=3415136 RepID=UPI003C7B1F45